MNIYCHACYNHVGGADLDKKLETRARSTVLKGSACSYPFARVIVDHKRVCRRRQKRAAVRGLGVLARCLVSGGHDDYSRHS